MSVTIWHNPRCSKSRKTLELLQEKGIDPEIRLYLEDAPSQSEIASVLEKLGIKPVELMRKNETEFKDQGLRGVTDGTALIEAMNQTPKLIERPVVIKGNKAAIGRPPESVLDIL